MMLRMKLDDLVFITVPPLDDLEFVVVRSRNELSQRLLAATDYAGLPRDRSRWQQGLQRRRDRAEGLR